ncbi:hypothetical protein QCA50_000270 [Cerrena zonata]|uniref:RRM domain-containing protein n=1 Tax=Cerrena zonata TaxID=2478898 RepID=A0AAW0GZT3_9APHY
MDSLYDSVPNRPPVWKNKRLRRPSSPEEEAKRKAVQEFWTKTYKGPRSLWVGNLSPSVNSEMIERAFRPKSVLGVVLHMHPDPRENGEGKTYHHARVHFRHPIWAYKALQNNGNILEGRPMLVTPFLTKMPHYRKNVLCDEPEGEESGMEPEPTLIVDE